MIKLSTIKENPDNPRTIHKAKFEKLISSIREFPEMMALRPMVIDENRVVLGGNMRLAALRELGFTEVKNDWVKTTKQLTDKQKQEFIIKDNIGFGEWDWDLLANEWNEQDLTDWGLELDWEVPKDESNDIGEGVTTDYKIEVVCDSEKHQEKVYNELLKTGYVCHILTL